MIFTLRHQIILMALLAAALTATGRAGRLIVADGATHKPLPGASVFSHRGSFIGVCRADGSLPFVSAGDYPLTVRYMGFSERTIPATETDTVFLQENVMELPEFVVQSRNQRLMHILAYVREYSTLSSYEDSVFMFREKMVDFMLPLDPGMRFKGWKRPRILASKSYYRFTDGMGLDSVSDRCNQHFSWTDWVGLAPAAPIPASISGETNATDTIRGRYIPKEIWTRKDDRITLDVNVMADTTSRKWVPNLWVFFRDDTDFEEFRIRFNYDNIIGDRISPKELTGYSFNIESHGRGHEMFMFNRKDQPFFVSTYAEVYMVDKEYITLKEAKKWENRTADGMLDEIYEPSDAPELQPAVMALMERVNNVDNDNIRVGMSPDHRLAGANRVKLNFGQQVFGRLKGLLGIDHAMAKRKWNKNWNEFRRERTKKNSKPRKEE